MALLKRLAGDGTIEPSFTASTTPDRRFAAHTHHPDPLLTAEEVAGRLRVSTDWVWDHSSRKKPFLPVIRMGDGTLRYRRSGIEAFIDERERISSMRRRAN